MLGFVPHPNLPCLKYMLREEHKTERRSEGRPDEECKQREYKNGQREHNSPKYVCR